MRQVWLQTGNRLAGFGPETARPGHDPTSDTMLNTTGRADSTDILVWVAYNTHAMNNERSEHIEDIAEAGAESADSSLPSTATEVPAAEVGGRSGLDPTRYGDWEKNGRCIDF